MPHDFALALLTFPVAHAGAEPVGPTAAEGQAIFAQYIDGRRLDRLAIQSFSVTDIRGVNGEAAGSHIFQYFDASLAMKQSGGIVTRTVGNDVDYPIGGIKVKALGNGQPEHRYKGRVDCRGERFVVRIDSLTVTYSGGGEQAIRNLVRGVDNLKGANCN